MSVTAVVVLWLAVGAWWDWRTRTVPNFLTLPPLGLALLARLAWGRWEAVEMLLVVGYLWLWQRGAIGGADAKIGLTLTLLSPWWGYGALLGVVALGVVWKLAERDHHTPAVVGMFAAVFFRELLAFHL